MKPEKLIDLLQLDVSPSAQYAVGTKGKVNEVYVMSKGLLLQLLAREDHLITMVSPSLDNVRPEISRVSVDNVDGFFDFLKRSREH